MALPPGRASAVGLRELLDALLGLVFPPRCRVCGCDGREPICGTCFERLERITGPICHLCGAPMDPHTHHGNLCSDCKKRRHFDSVRSVCANTGLCRRAVHRFKYDSLRELGAPLGQVLVDYAQTAFRPGETIDPYYTPPRAIPFEDLHVIVPVPLSPQRKADRTFNQAEVLGAVLSEAVGRPMQVDVLRRIRDTQPQVELSAKDRVRNVRGAFSVGARDAVRDREVLLVDDVCTTGATLDECAKTLKRAGATFVYGMTVARQTNLFPGDAAPGGDVDPATATGDDPERP